MIASIILTHNEQDQISACLASLQFCDEQIVIDDNSTDQTVSIATSLGAKIVTRSLDNDFASQRNVAFENSTAEWFLFIDADERVTKKLQDEIKEAAMSKDIQSYYIPRIDNFWKKELRYGEVKRASELGFIRLVRRGSGKWKGHVHEEFVSKEPIGYLKNALQHTPHPSVTSFLHKINRYSTLRALELSSQGEKSSVFKVLVYPFAKFIYTYILLFGFKDGAAGFVYSFMMSFHSFLVRSKLYQYQHIDHESH